MKKLGGCGKGVKAMKGQGCLLYIWDLKAYSKSNSIPGNSVTESSK